MIVMAIAASKVLPTGEMKGGQHICSNLFPHPPPPLWLYREYLQVSAVSAELTARRSPVSLDSLVPHIEGHSTRITCIFGAVRAGQSRADLRLSATMSQMHRSKQSQRYFSAITIQSGSSVSAVRSSG